MPSISVLVLSCDKYKAFWPIFFDRFFKNWPKCTGDVYLMSNMSAFKYPGVEVLSIGDDKDWSSNLIKCLELIKTEYVILMLEDAVLTNKTDIESLELQIEQGVSKNVDMLNLKPSGPRTKEAERYWLS